jgi:two-component system response regulator BaeR
MTETKPYRIFVVEDDAKIAAVLHDYLHADGYRPEVFPDGRQLVTAVRDDPPDAIILDLMLPGTDGLQLCYQLRAFSAVPILMLTARVDEADRLRGLDGGADDYVCKPFSAREVIARIAALIRRVEGRVVNEQAPEHGYAVDTLGQRVAWAGHWLGLSPSEHAILGPMMKQPGRVFTRDQLLEKLRDGALDTSDRAIDSHIKNIRKKIWVVDPDARCIVSVYGVGYRFDP